MLRTSQNLWNEACGVLAGGVDSPVRSFKNVGGVPVFIDHAEGAYLWDVEGKKYIDYVGSWGPAILGHAAPNVVKSVQLAAQRGMSFGAPCAAETELAEIIRDVVPSMERIRFVNSGTEATMSALRLARGATKRDKILKFSGCYHGHADCLLVQAGSGALTLGEPDSAGVPADFARHTLVAEYNDLEAASQIMAKHSKEVAAIIVEPVAGNMGCVLPHPEFLLGLRSLCDQHGALLIFDEVMTGFRVALGGAQSIYKVKPDLTCLGKVIGGGLPVGAYGGRREIMDLLAPLGPVYQAGTLSGNPLAMAAGIATLSELKKSQVYEKLSQMARQLTAGLKEVCDSLDVPCQTATIGGMFGLFFNPAPVHNLLNAQTSDTLLFKKYFHAMLNRGIYLAPSPYEAGFVSLAHTESDIEATLKAARSSLQN